MTPMVRDQLHRERRDRSRVVGRLKAVSDAGRLLPRLDDRTDDEILGYDEHGLPS
jgi:hypothetical protein